jgi:hypothetical protein
MGNLILFSSSQRSVGTIAKSNNYECASNKALSKSGLLNIFFERIEGSL